jgi:MYXO-CTERM domain-containing protein
MPLTPRNTDMMDRADFLDTDADNDGVTDRVEAGTDPRVPVNTDGDPEGADYVDLDSDNDCLPDRDPAEAGAARTNALLPRAMSNLNCTDPMLPVCNTTMGRCVSDVDSDGDGVPNLVETRLGTDPMRADSDMDGVPDGRELGAGPTFMAIDTDRDGTIDALDTDDDGDGLATRDELGDPASPRNSNATVPMGEGTANMLADYLDADDDGDGIPTSVERSAEGMIAGDDDGTPAHLDRDSDGDTVPDAVERGESLMTPANTDGTDRPDFLDPNSDNDCLLDRDPNEAGAARITVAMNPNTGCMGDTPTCDTTRGVCVSCFIAMGGRSVGCERSTHGSLCLPGAVEREAARCGCRDDSHCPMTQRCDTAPGQCVARPIPDASVTDVMEVDASDAGTTSDGAMVRADSGKGMDGGIDAGAPSSGVVYVGGGCGCVVGSAPSGARPASLGLLFGVAVFARRRRNAARR